MTKQSDSWVEKENSKLTTSKAEERSREEEKMEEKRREEERGAQKSVKYVSECMHICMNTQADVKVAQ